MKNIFALAGFALGILLAQHYHQRDWGMYTSTSVQQCTKGARG